MESCHHKFTLRWCEKSDKSFEVDKKNLNTEFLRRIGQVMSRKMVSVDTSKQNIWKTVKKNNKTYLFLNISAKKKKKKIWRGDGTLVCDPNWFEFFPYIL